MEKVKFESGMWADLYSGRLSANSAWSKLLDRAELFIEAGLPLEKVLDALDMSRATYYRKVAERKAERAATLATAHDHERREAIGARRHNPALMVVHHAFNEQTRGDRNDALCGLWLDDFDTFQDSWSTEYPEITCGACRAKITDYGWFQYA